MVPPELRRSFRRCWEGQRYHPVVGHVRFGDLRRLKPLSNIFGWDRGMPIDRYYLDQFLAAHTNDIAGHVMEIGDADYTRKFGGSRVTRSDVLSIDKENPEATIIADLTQADHIPSDTFDCILLVQTLQFIFDTRAALATIQRILKPGGIVLATFSGISQIAHADSKDGWADCWFWNFTSVSARRLFADHFPEANLRVEAFGNVLTATGFLQGLAARELTPAELDFRDPDYDVLVTVRAQKPQVR